MLSRPACTAAALAAALVSVAPVVRADLTKAQCIEANTQAQDLRRDGKLSAARTALRSCAATSCPAMIRNDCTHRLDELDKAQPTLVFDAKDPSGNDLSVVRVTVDGTVLTEKLDGSPLQIDPGEHVFEFSAAGQAPVKKTLVLAEGDKGRREHIAFVATKLAPAPAPAPAAATPSSASSGPAPASGDARSSGLSTTQVLGLVAGGLGVAGIATGGVFGLLTGSAWNSQKTDCASATNCTNHAQAVSDHSTVMTDGTISTVSFIAGGVLLAGGVALYFAGKHPQEKPGDSTASLAVTPSIGPSGAALSLQGGF